MPEEAIIYPAKRSCPECLGVAAITTFRPAPGLDQGMREYICPDCHYDFYLTPKAPRKKLHIETEELPM